MLGHFLWRWAGNSLAFLIAERLLENVRVDGGLAVILIAALIFAAINSFIKPIITILSLPAIILSLGLFILVINGFMLYLVTVIYPSFQILTLGAGFATLLIVWIVNWALSSIGEV